MKLVVGLLLGGALGVVVARRLRPAAAPVEPAPPAPVAAVDPGPARVPVDVSAFAG